MLAVNDSDLALSMVRLWGANAVAVADGYAENYADHIDTDRSEQWHRVKLLIAKFEIYISKGSRGLTNTTR